MEILRKNEMLKIKNTVKETKNGLISRLDIVEGRLSELEDMIIETSKAENQKGKKKKNEKA